MGLLKLRVSNTPHSARFQIEKLKVGYMYVLINMLQEIFINYRISGNLKTSLQKLGFQFSYSEFFTTFAAVFVSKDQI